MKKLIYYREENKDYDEFNENVKQRFDKVKDEIVFDYAYNQNVYCVNGKYVRFLMLVKKYVEILLIDYLNKYYFCFV